MTGEPALPIDELLRVLDEHPRDCPTCIAARQARERAVPQPIPPVDELLEQLTGNPWFTPEPAAAEQLAGDDVAELRRALDEDPNRLCGVCERPLRHCLSRCRTRSEDHT